MVVVVVVGRHATARTRGATAMGATAATGLLTLLGVRLCMDGAALGGGGARQLQSAGTPSP